MNEVTKPDLAREVVARAVQFAQIRGDGTVSPTHLLLAVMAERETQWPLHIVERGGFSFDLALRRLQWPELAAVSRVSPEARLYRVSMRLTVMIVVAAPFIALWRRLTVVVQPLQRPRLDRAAADVLQAASEWPYPPERQSRDTGTGRLLLTLATTAGGHLRLLDNANVLACAIRRDLGLDRWHHRLILRLDWPKLMTRGARAWLHRRVTERGWLSVSGLAFLGFRGIGLLTAAILFFITVPATLVLYLFLWPFASPHYGYPHSSLPLRWLRHTRPQVV